MLFQLLHGAKCELALDALEGILNVVDIFDVGDEVRLLPERRGAHLALVRLGPPVHHGHVFLQRALGGALVVAGRALVRLLFQVNCDHVLLQVGFLSKLCRADITCEGFFLLVDGSHVLLHETFG